MGRGQDSRVLLRTTLIVGIGTMAEKLERGPDL